MHSELTKKNGCEKQTWKIKDVVLALGSEIARHVLFIHAWTGCDTTSVPLDEPHLDAVRGLI